MAKWSLLLKGWANAGILVVALLLATPALAQDAVATLSGAITDAAGKIVPNAKVSVRNVATGQSTETQSDSTGLYNAPNLMPGDYEVTASAEGIGTKTAKITLAAGTVLKTDLALSANPATPQDNLPDAPSSKTGPSLQDLGISTEQTQGNAKEQALLDKRTHMLKVHQRLGLITTVPLLATLALSVNAGGKNTSSLARDTHVALGAVTGDLYFITAYYAIRAPRISGTETRGPIRLHKALAWIHGPGMILTPILGTLAFNQASKGEKLHGIAAAHGAVAIVTAGAFGAALLSVSLKF